MKKSVYNSLKIGIALALVILLGACARDATQRDVRINSLLEEAQNTANQALSTARDAQSTADEALTTAEEASSKADAAQQTADEAFQAVTECCAKVDRMFEKAMSK
jgi:phosphate uptake regulator